MERDTVLVTDMNDALIGSASKKSSHEFSPSQPYGILHRAFSVFLFDSSTNELLLQKRASTKITFPNVWTNTCCSHPLHGMDVSEIDEPQDVMDGSVRGVKNAAVRKLEHELGIPVGELKRDEFKFLTRVHYWAADTVTHGVKRWVCVRMMKHLFSFVKCSFIINSFHNIIASCYLLTAHGENMKLTISSLPPSLRRTN
jgi:isopentenyl-diphosphate delta-isomerase